ncbi:MAG: DUF5787 family protein, partial [Halobacteriaceae archaeon]
SVVRQVARYPADWYGELVGVENKPDLGEPGDLADQLRTDVGLGLFDRVVLATGSYVTGAHRNRLPDAVGIWRVDFADDDPIEVVRPAAPLATDGPGVQLLERHPSHADVRFADADEIGRCRRRLAERAWGKGWRTHFPACARVAAREADAGGDGGADSAGTAALPHCAWAGRVVDPGRECGPSCPGHEPSRPPRVDVAAERERRQPWVADPEGRARRQATLDRF